MFVALIVRVTLILWFILYCEIHEINVSWLFHVKTYLQSLPNWSPVYTKIPRRSKDVEGLREAVIINKTSIDSK